MKNEEDTPCACGCCDACYRRASLHAADYVLKKRFRQRRSYNRSDPEERRYVHTQVKLLLAMTGLAPEDIYPEEERRRSDWGRAMRSRQQ